MENGGEMDLNINTGINNPKTVEELEKDRMKTVTKIKQEVLARSKAKHQAKLDARNRKGPPGYTGPLIDPIRGIKETLTLIRSKLPQPKST